MKLEKSPGITARNDTAWVQFGAGLPEDELKYLHALIKTEIARRIGITQPAVSISVRRGERIAKEMKFMIDDSSHYNFMGIPFLPKQAYLQEG